MTPEEVYALTPRLIAKMHAWGDRLELAEDAAAEVVAYFVGKGGAPSVNYVLTAARHELARHYRGARDTLALDAERGDDGCTLLDCGAAALTAEAPDDAVIGRLDARAMLAGCRIPCDQAEALRLRFVDDLTWEQVGERMGVTSLQALHLGNHGIAALRVRLGVREAPHTRGGGAKLTKTQLYLAIPRDPERQAAAERPGGRRGRLKVAA